MRVSRNWRIVFRIEKLEIRDVNLEDCHQNGTFIMAMRNPPHPGVHSPTGVDGRRDVCV